MAYSLTSLDTSHDWCPSLGVSKSWCRSARWWLAPWLTFEYHNQTGICFTNTRNYCDRNKTYVLTSPLKQIYLQPALCARIIVLWTRCVILVVTIANSRPGALMKSDVAFVDSRWRHNCCHWQSETISNLRHDLSRDLTKSRWFSLVNTTWWPQMQIHLQAPIGHVTLVAITATTNLGPTHLVKWWLDKFERVPGGRLNKKDGLTRYGDSHVKDKTS